MTTKFKDAPGWVQLLLGLATALISATLVYANLQSDVTLLQKEDSILHQKDTELEKAVIEIKGLIREEMDRHHPRK